MSKHYATCGRCGQQSVEERSFRAIEVTPHNERAWQTREGIARQVVCTNPYCHCASWMKWPDGVFAWQGIENEAASLRYK